MGLRADVAEPVEVGEDFGGYGLVLDRAVVPDVDVVRLVPVVDGFEDAAAAEAAGEVGSVEGSGAVLDTAEFVAAGIVSQPGAGLGRFERQVEVGHLHRPQPLQPQAGAVVQERAGLAEAAGRHLRLPLQLVQPLPHIRRR